eukprot:gene4332-14444_t
MLHNLVSNPSLRAPAQFPKHACCHAVSLFPRAAVRQTVFRNKPVDALRCRVDKKRVAVRASATSAPACVKPEGEVTGMTAFLDSLKFDANGLVAIVVQPSDVLQPVEEGALVQGRDIRQLYQCAWGVCRLRPNCWFTEIKLAPEEQILIQGDHTHEDHTPATTLMSLERTIQARRAAAESGTEGPKPSWTARLLTNEELLCKKIREEAGELCETLEKNEGKERAASEMADLLYHAMVLLNKQVLRKREGTSGVEEKASRPKK